jgi:hypothetical protein
MWSFSCLRNNPHYGRLFDRVHPLCWLILWWQLNLLFRKVAADRTLDVLYSVNEWGFITIRYVARCEDPASYKPIPRTFRPLTDASWESDTPEAQRNLILPRLRGRWPEGPEGALPLHLIPNTSLYCCFDVRFG